MKKVIMVLGVMFATTTALAQTTTKSKQVANATTTEVYSKAKFPDNTDDVEEKWVAVPNEFLKSMVTITNDSKPWPKIDQDLPQNMPSSVSAKFKAAMQKQGYAFLTETGLTNGDTYTLSFSGAKIIWKLAAADEWMASVILQCDNMDEFRKMAVKLGHPTKDENFNVSRDSNKLSISVY
jgi:hypothetical protein